MADIVRRQGTAPRSIFGDVFGFDPFRMMMQGGEVYGMEARRSDTGYEIDVPMAGFRPEDVSVTVEDRVLTIEGRNERRRFTRSVTLPDEVDEERIDARVEHGMLTLTLPLTPRAQPRRIDIRVGSQATGERGSAIDGSAETMGT
jgi:HSP20 family protein